MANDSVKIKHPTDKNLAKRAVPRKFVATGLAKGTAIKKVKGTVTEKTSGKVTDGKQIMWITRGAQGHKYRWMIFFSVEADGKYDLVVRGYDKDDDKICDATAGPFEVREVKRIAPTIDYPAEDGADITDEAGYFVTYGSYTHPVILATHHTQPAEYIYNDSAFWVVQFGELINDGTRNITVTDTSDNSQVRSVVIIL